MNGSKATEIGPPQPDVGRHAHCPARRLSARHGIASYRAATSNRKIVDGTQTLDVAELFEVLPVALLKSS